MARHESKRSIGVTGYVAAWLVIVSASSAPAGAATVVIYSAGSLRGVVAELAREAGPLLHVAVQPTFGGSGALRERIEKGASPDLFMSADVGSPGKLAAEGRTVVPVIAFARNRMCFVSRRSLGITPQNLIDRLLAPGVRLKTSTPLADPAGDYAWTILGHMNELHPGAGAILEQKARATMNLQPAASVPPQNRAAALFRSNQVDVSITYCSGAAALLKQVPQLTSLVVPPRLDPHPLYGLAILSARPEVLRLALYLLSAKGQAIIARERLVPLTMSTATPP